MNEERLVTQITPKSEDFSRWYVDLIRRAELADYAPMKGMMVIRPYGYAIWENIQRLLDRRIKASGHVNAYFPVFIPESFLRKEMEHLKGFAPEVAWVTHGGEDELEERLAVRPTSEAIIGHMYSKWIQSWRDLPVLINQWGNVVRWEKVTRPFLRTTEFLWQEGHTAHETFEEAQEETLRILEMYREFVETELAIPVLAGKKTDREKFAGAEATYAIEALMSDGKALQMGTSHNLGQHFARVFDIKFEDRNQKLQYVWQTSWGVSTRLIGALVMSHGDDSGLVFPPQVAPIQVIIVPISIGNWRESVLPVARKLKDSLQQAGYRTHLDDRSEYTPGWKFSEWEMRGVPLRLEIGPRDVKNNQVIAVRRDTKEKSALEMSGIEGRVGEMLVVIQKTLFERALSFQKENTREAENYEEFKKTIEEKRGFIRALWCGGEECEARIKEETMATIRVIPFQENNVTGKCVCCGQEARTNAYFARAY
ncbi:MAG: proline--tRNA ligase [Candidatus Saccharicenans sp.]|nr:proline--tRNA ligase [Candidatus Saccharicenans sp.]MDI6849532.1 proline--tRNA ligase [Candidatus Saccharicenans sp.]